MKAAIYARVSTSEQTKGYSLPSQIKGCQAYAELHGFEVAAVIQDDISGATRLEEREGGRQLLELIEAGAVKAVIVWRLDRISRPPEDELSRLLTTVEHMRRHGVTLHDCEGGPVKDDMASIMITFFKGIAASQERAAIRERSMRGKRERARAGKWMGAWPPYGFTRMGHRRDSYLVINEDEAAIVKRIFKLYSGAGGCKPMPLNDIARLLSSEGIPTPGRAMGPSKVWLASTLTDSVIDNRGLIGRFTYAGIESYLPHLRIVDDELWELAQAQREINKHRSRRKRPGPLFLLSARMSCVCGGAIHGSSVRGWKGRVYRYYRCCRARHDGVAERCTLGQVRADDIEAEAWDWLAGLVANDARLDEVIEEMAGRAAAELEPIKQELAAIDGMMAQAERKVARLMAAFGDADDEIVAAALKSEITQAGKLKASLAKRQDDLMGQIANTEITDGMKDEIKVIARQVRERIREGGTDENKRALIEALDVRGELFYADDGQLKMRVSCGLGSNTGFISVNSPSST